MVEEKELADMYIEATHIAESFTNLSALQKLPISEEAKRKVKSEVLKNVEEKLLRLADRVRELTGKL
jgi:hypothetical protein